MARAARNATPHVVASMYFITDTAGQNFSTRSKIHSSKPTARERAFPALTSRKNKTSITARKDKRNTLAATVTQRGRNRNGDKIQSGHFSGSKIASRRSWMATIPLANVTTCAAMRLVTNRCDWLAICAELLRQRGSLPERCSILALASNSSLLTRAESERVSSNQVGRRKL